jgi:hypothetical protein
LSSSSQRWGDRQVDEETDRGRSVGAVVRAVVEQAAPEELPILDGIGGMDDATVVARFVRGGPSDERLGFGLDDLAVLVSPVLYIVLDQAVRKLVDDSIDDTRRKLPGWLRRMARRRTSTPHVPELSEKQVAEIRDQVAALALERGVPRDKVEQVQRAVVEVLTDTGGTTSTDAPPAV